MPIQSHQISGLIGGQQVMFANQAAYSQQISNQYYGTEAPLAQMQNPFPTSTNYGVEGYGSTGGNIGTSITGGIGQALPGIAAGASMLAGIAGGPLGAFDPFTVVPRAFGLGTGTTGGLMAGLGNVGRAFATRGVMGGLGTLGGGLALGAASALPFMAAAKGIEYVGQTMYEGAQEQGAVGAIAQRMGPWYGTGGGRPGGQLPRRQIQALTGMLYEMTSQDAATSSQELLSLLDKAERHGLFAGVTNPQQLQTRFRDMVKQVKTIAQVVGTTMDEAMPVLGELKRMGMWRPEDVLGTATAIRTVGTQNAPALMQTMQAGAQMSWQRGGTLQAGARTGQQAFLGVQAAMGAGVMNEEMLREMTGGVGGIEGQRMVAGQMTQTIQGLAAGTSIGKMMVAGLGEQVEGRYTGRVDPELMRRFASGGMSVAELERLGEQKTATQGGLASFRTRGSRISQNIASEGGMQGVAQAIKAVIQRAGYSGAGEDEKEIFIQTITGMDQRSAEMWRKLIDEMPRIQREAADRGRRAAADALREMDTRQNKSLQGLKDVVKGMIYNQFERPIKEVQSEMSTRIGQLTDEFTERLMGRGGVGGALERGVTLGGLIGPGAGAAGAGGGGRGEYIRMETPFLERMRGYAEQASPFRAAWRGEVLGADAATRGENIAGLMRAAGLTTEVREGERGFETGVTLRALAGGRAEQAREADTNLVARRTQLWSKESTGLKELGFEKDAESSDDFNVVAEEVEKLLTGRGDVSIEQLEEMRRGSGGKEGNYMESLMKNLSPRGRQAMERLAEKGSKDLPSGLKRMDVFARAAKKSGVSGPRGLDFEKMARQNVQLAVTSESRSIATAAAKANKESQKMMHELVKDDIFDVESRTTKGVFAGIAGLGGLAAVALPAGAVVGMVGALAAGAESLIRGVPVKSTRAYNLPSSLYEGIVGGARDLFASVAGDISTKDIEDAHLNEDWGDDFKRWISGEDTSTSNKFYQEYKKGTPEVVKLYEWLESKKSSDPTGYQSLRTMMGNTVKHDLMKKTDEKATRNKALASTELGRLDKMPEKKFGGTLRERYKSLLEAYQGKDQKEIQKRTEELGTELQKRPGGITQLIGTGGAIAGLEAGKALTQRLTAGGGGMGVGQFEEQMQKIQGALGYDPTALLTEEQRKTIEGYKKDKKVDYFERMQVRDLLTDVIKKKGAQEKAGESREEQTLQTLNGVLTKNAEFVQITSNAIEKIGKAVGIPKPGTESGATTHAPPGGAQAPEAE